jgi:hypothetical protein
VSPDVVRWTTTGRPRGGWGATPGPSVPVRACEGSKEGRRPRYYQLRRATKSPAEAGGESLHRDGVSRGCSFRESYAGSEAGLIFHIVTASVTALAQISASMVVPFSLTTQSLMRRPSRVEEGFGLEQTRFALAGEYQGRFGIENDRPTPPGRAEIAQLNTNE